LVYPAFNSLIAGQTKTRQTVPFCHPNGKPKF
jgi:hypothetical protein